MALKKTCGSFAAVRAVYFLQASFSSEEKPFQPFNLTKLQKSKKNQCKISIITKDSLAYKISFPNIILLWALSTKF